jgi:divalent metal cation (Fe/Co/Zn/Cd) transporter
MRDVLPEAQLLRRGFHLEYATLSWNAVGFVVLILSALAAGSVALAGFGVDSLIEIVASLVVIWQLRDAHDGRTRVALRVIAVGFGMLAAYIAVQASYTLAATDHPGHSTSGIVWLALTVVAMLALAAGKRATGARLGNPVLQTEARVTMIDGLLAGAVLAGIVLNAAAGWWWADPASAFVIMLYAIREAQHAWRKAPDASERASPSTSHAGP